MRVLLAFLLDGPLSDKQFKDLEHEHQHSSENYLQPVFEGGDLGSQFLECSEIMIMLLAEGYLYGFSYHFTINDGATKSVLNASLFNRKVIRSWEMAPIWDTATASEIILQFVLMSFWIQLN